MRDTDRFRVGPRDARILNAQSDDGVLMTSVELCERVEVGASLEVVAWRYEITGGERHALYEVDVDERRVRALHLPDSRHWYVTEEERGGFGER